MNTIKAKSRHWIQLGAAVALGGLVAAAFAAPSALTPLPPLENTTLQVLEQESHGPQKISNGEFESAQAMSATFNNIEGSLDSSSDADVYRIDVPVGQTLSVALANSNGAHEFKVYQYIASDAALTHVGLLMMQGERDEQWTYKEVDSAHAGSDLQVLPGSFTLKRGMDEYAARDGVDPGFSMDRLSPYYFVKVQPKAGAVKPAGRYGLQVNSTAPQTP